VISASATVMTRPHRRARDHTEDMAALRGDASTKICGSKQSGRRQRERCSSESSGSCIEVDPAGKNRKRRPRTAAGRHCVHTWKYQLKQIQRDILSVKSHPGAQVVRRRPTSAACETATPVSGPPPTIYSVARPDEWMTVACRRTDQWRERFREPSFASNRTPALYPGQVGARPT